MRFKYLVVPNEFTYRYTVLLYEIQVSNKSISLFRSRRRRCLTYSYVYSTIWLSHLLVFYMKYLTFLVLYILGVTRLFLILSNFYQTNQAIEMTLSLFILRILVIIYTLLIALSFIVSHWVFTQLHRRLSCSTFSINTDCWLCVSSDSISGHFRKI